MEIKRNARAIAAARKAWRWCVLIPFLGSLSAGICLVNPSGRPPVCYAKVSKSLSQPPRLGIRHSLAAHATVGVAKALRAFLSESPTSAITALNQGR
jgi:hypothetical protein